MKKTLASLLGLPLLTAASLAGNWFGGSPWALGAYYPGQLDGKYQAAVYGANITGVVGFAIVDGAPPYKITETQDAPFFATAVNTAISTDETQNYFAIFDSGRTYVGTTVASIDVERNSVTGVLNGIQPTIAYTNLTVSIPNPPNDPLQSIIPIVDNSFLLARGLSGGFTAQLNNKSTTFSFQGTGELSSAADTQTINANPNFWQIPGAPLGEGVNGFNIATTSANIVTASRPFNIRGLKTSLRSTNANFSTGTGN
jgi:hypothetical protein